MVDLIAAITKGIDLYSFFYSKYYGPIKYRPLSSFELTLVVEDSVSKSPWEVKEFIRDVHIKHKMPENLPREMSREAVKAYERMCQLIVFHAVKDFQPENWQHEKDGVPLGMALLESNNNFLEVEEMARDVLSLTTCPTATMESFLKTSDGKVLASAVWKLEVPLTDKLWKMTDLQLLFITCTSNNKKIKKSAEDMRLVLPNPVPLASPEEAALIEKCESIRKKMMK